MRMSLQRARHPGPRAAQAALLSPLQRDPALTAQCSRRTWAMPHDAELYIFFGFSQLQVSLEARSRHVAKTLVQRHRCSRSPLGHGALQPQDRRSRHGPRRALSSAPPRPLRFCASAPLRLRASAPPRLFASAPPRLALLRFRASAPPRLGAAAPPRLCASVPLCASAPLRPLRLCASAPLRLCAAAPLRLCASAPLRPRVSAPLRFCASAPLRPCASAPLRLCASAPPRLIPPSNQQVIGVSSPPVRRFDRRGGLIPSDALDTSIIGASGHIDHQLAGLTVPDQELLEVDARTLTEFTIVVSHRSALALVDDGSAFLFSPLDRYPASRMDSWSRARRARVPSRASASRGTCTTRARSSSWSLPSQSPWPARAWRARAATRSSPTSSRSTSSWTSSSPRRPRLGARSRRRRRRFVALRFCVGVRPGSRARTPARTHRLLALTRTRPPSPRFADLPHVDTSSGADDFPSLRSTTPRASLGGFAWALSDRCAGACASLRSTLLGRRARCSQATSAAPTARSRSSTCTCSTRTSSSSTTTPRGSSRPLSGPCLSGPSARFTLGPRRRGPRVHLAPRPRSPGAQVRRRPLSRSLGRHGTTELKLARMARFSSELNDRFSSARHRACPPARRDDPRPAPRLLTLPLGHGALQPQDRRPRRGLRRARSSAPLRLCASAPLRFRASATLRISAPLPRRLCASAPCAPSSRQVVGASSPPCAALRRVGRLGPARPHAPRCPPRRSVPGRTLPRRPPRRVTT